MWWRWTWTWRVLRLMETTWRETTWRETTWRETTWRETTWRDNLERDNVETTWSLLACSAGVGLCDYWYVFRFLHLNYTRVYHTCMQWMSTLRLACLLCLPYVSVQRVCHACHSLCHVCLLTTDCHAVTLIKSSSPLSSVCSLKKHQTYITSNLILHQYHRSSLKFYSLHTCARIVLGLYTYRVCVYQSDLECYRCKSDDDVVMISELTLDNVCRRFVESFSKLMRYPTVLSICSLYKHCS